MSDIINSTQTDNPKVNPIRRAVSIKKGSGTMFISKSVDGSSIHKSFVKKIWWKTIKYFEKSVDITANRKADTAKNSPEPRQNVFESINFKFDFNTSKTITDIKAATIHKKRSLIAPMKRLRTSSI